MKLTLSESLVKSIKESLKQAQEDRWVDAQNVDILVDSAEKIKRLKDAFYAAKKAWNDAESLQAGTPAEVVNGILRWGTRPDNRPEGWLGQRAYSIPSRSGGPDHQITTDRLTYSCNCKAAVFGETCWAVKQLSLPGVLPLRTYVYNRGLNAPPEFGLIRND